MEPVYAGMSLYQLMGRCLEEARLDNRYSLETFRCYRSRMHDFHRWLVAYSLGEPEPLPRGKRQPPQTKGQASDAKGQASAEAVTITDKAESLTAADAQELLLPTDFTMFVGREYLRSLRERGLRPRTVKAHFNALRALGKWLLAERILPENPASPLRPPKLDAVERPYVTDSQLAALLGACPALGTKRGSLAYAMLSLFTYTGMRREECLSLRLSDIQIDGPDGDRCVIIRRGKGGRRRVIYPYPALFEAVAHWLNVRPGLADDWLFAFDTKRRVHTKGLTALFADLSDAAGLKGPVYPHDIRHTFARRSLRNGVDLPTLQAIMGHERLETTAMYLKTDDERLREAATMGALRLKNSQATAP